MKKPIPDSRITVLVFLGIILLGTGLLMLPIATRPGLTTRPVDALFTATSATCVTGLIIYDTFSHWTAFGQAVILGLIQIGGLGFMSVATLFSLALGRKIGLREREMIQEAVNTTQVGGIVRLMRYVLIGTLFFEAMGAILLSIRFIPQMGVGQGIWYAVFHSVSAFCNAGFDLMGQFAPYSSLTAYRGDVLVNVVVMLLIVIGGLGFSVWEDLARNRFAFSRYRLQTKMVLTVSAVLLLVPAVLFFFLEYHGSMEGSGMGEKVLASFFQSVTFRTAGFNTVDLAALHDSSVLVSLVLMFIGGSPGSTAGGVKTTTFLVLVMALAAMVRGRKAVGGFGRRLEDDLVRRALSIFAVYFACILTAAGLLCFADGVPLKECLFEVFSAAGTVGVTMGVTQQIGDFSKVVLAMLMLFGRIGGLSMALAFARPLLSPPVLSPVEKIAVG